MSWQEREDEYLVGARQELRDRCRQELATFVRDLAPWTLFMTLTFDPLVMAGTSPAALAKGRQQLAVPAVSRWTAMRRFRYFLEHTSRTLERATVGVIALEPHESGQPHGHGLLDTEGGVVGQEVAQLGRLWRDYPGNGWIRLEEPRSQEDVTGYCAKYLAKDASELVFSSSLKRPARPEDGSGAAALAWPAPSGVRA
jgi:hypothetical protein